MLSTRPYLHHLNIYSNIETIIAECKQQHFQYVTINYFLNYKGLDGALQFIRNVVFETEDAIVDMSLYICGQFLSFFSPYAIYVSLKISGIDKLS